MAIPTGNRQYLERLSSEVPEEAVLQVLAPAKFVDRAVESSVTGGCCRCGHQAPIASVSGVVFASKDSGSSFRYARGIRVLGCFWFSAMMLFIAHHVVSDMSNEPSEGDPFKRTRVDFGVTCDDFTPTQP